MKRFDFRGIIKEISKNKFTIFICVLFSIILWILTIMYGKDSYSVIKIKDIPITTNFSNTQAEQLGLSVVDLDPNYVSVYLRGPRHKLSFLKKEDVIVTPKSYSSITSGGKYNLELTAYLKKQQQGITIEGISEKNAAFSIDVLETKSFKLVPDDVDVTVEDGFIKDETVCQPNVLSVSGPKQYIDRLDSVKLHADVFVSDLDFTKTFNAYPKFIASDGSKIDSSVFKYNKDIKFSITIPVYKIKRVPFKILYKNAPDKLDLNLLKPEIEPKEIEIYGAQDLLKNINEINLGYVDLRELSEDRTNFLFNINLPEGVQNSEQISSANVYFNRNDSNRFGSRTFDVVGAQLLNIPSNFDVVVSSKIIKDIRISGLKRFLKGMEAENITATIDCSKIDLKEGRQNVPVKIGVIKDGVWPVGEYKCSINVKKK